MIRRFSCFSSLLWVAIIPVEWGTRRDARKPWDGGQGRGGGGGGGGGSPCTGPAPRLPPLQTQAQQTSMRQFIRRATLRGEKWKKQNRKRWKEAGESENYIIGRQTTNRKRKRAALTPPPTAAAAARCSDLFQLDSSRVSVRVLVSSADICQPATSNYCPLPGEANSQLERQNESLTVKFDLTRWLHYLPPLLWLLSWF